MSGSMTVMTALYQRARPATFAEVVGQEHVKDVLLAALQRGRPSHAYLFSGPRGVGKTTTARLLAMALNCEADVGVGRPCGKCDGCRMVREGHHPDVIELDAASNNSVDDVRDLREKTNLVSMRGGTRVWILDEAHMLSKAAANALLKTLEEPPPGLVFVLATTEPEKLPSTVLSRCQHFRFRRHTEAEILGKLERLCREATVGGAADSPAGNGIEAEPEALALLARAADGAMRDAESLLERLLTPGTKITLAATEDALGLPPVHRMQLLATALASNDLATVLTEAEALYRDGFAPRSLADNLGTVLRDALRNEVIGNSATVVGSTVVGSTVVGATVVGSNGADGAPAAHEADRPGFRLPVERAALLRLIHALDDEQDRFIRRDDLYSLEVALLKGLNALTGNVPAATGQPSAAEEKGRPFDNTSDKLPSFDPTGRGPVPARKKTGAKAKGEGEGEGAKVEAAGTGSSNHRAQPSAEASAVSVSQGKKFDWHAVRSAAGPQLKAFLAPAQESIEGHDVVIRYSDTHKFHYSEIRKRQNELERLIEEIAGSGYRLHIEGPGEPAAKKS
ncbi:MAG: DNA polymerase III subunit gamma/tau [Trueperaceae bacterium]